MLTNEEQERKFCGEKKCSFKPHAKRVTFIFRVVVFVYREDD